MKRRASSAGGVRRLLIEEWERRCARWPVPGGIAEQELEDLRAGRPVVVHSDRLLSVFLREGLPVDRFCYGGEDYEKLFLLDERDQLREYVDE